MTARESSPTVGLYEPVIRNALKQAWQESQPGRTGGHEEGGFILRNEAGKISVMRGPRGESDSILMLPHADYRIGEKEIIGTFHTHPNTGSDYLQEPGDADRRAVRDDPDLRVRPPPPLPGCVYTFMAIISLLEKSIKLTDEGKYPLEEAVHRIIFPMTTTSNDIDYERQNLWLIDERLSYHHFLASDKPLNTVDVINTESGLEPDLLVFNKALAYAEAPAPFTSVVIVEFKRPMRKGYTEDENPFEQVIKYITRIRESKALDREGRPIPVNDNTPFYAYIICDRTARLINYAENYYDYTPTPDGLGYFNFNKNLKAYIEVISYTKLVQDAQKRNRVLFEKLNLPT